MKIVSEFKKFIARGNILDLAVAVIIGGAFTKIVNSFVKDVLMPVISLALGGNGFENYKYVIVPETVELDGTIIAENAIYYGLFIQNIVDFIIIAFVVFMIVKIINKMKEASEELIEKEIEEKKS
ncbi:MAG: large conductance mechanosensitive channel protein MscL [Bacilli bacterium]|nr:large conductance mechanosensitive channel protein MscL [Bacilli bacterium]